MLKKIILLFLLNFDAQALVIRPMSEGWYNANPIDVKAVSQSAANTLLEHMPTNLNLDTVVLKNAQEGPITLFQRDVHGEYIILVNIKGLHWAQLAYQFSHELCHILSHYEATKNDANQWFEESLCEAASLHAIKRMSHSWKTRPPYPAWKSYSSALKSYHQNLMAEQHRYLLANDTIEDWYQREKSSLRSHPEQRDKNEIIGTSIYSFFEENPKRWLSIKYINIGNINNDISLEQYLQDWENNLPSELKYVAQTVASWFGY